jgi:hypothetical protein
MTCCGQKRTALAEAAGLSRASPMPTAARPAPPATGQGARALPSSASSSMGAMVTLRYLEQSPIRVRGPSSGRLYEFSGNGHSQAVERRDAEALLQTPFFRQVS